MSNLVGRVHFNASLDGKGTEKDAKDIGNRAGVAGSEAFDKQWNKSFRETLSKSGKTAFDAWHKQGARDGGIYGDALGQRLDASIKRALKNFAGIRLDPGFIDDFAGGFASAEAAVDDLRRQINILQENTDGGASSFDAARRQVDEWAEAQRRAAAAAEETAVTHRRAVDDLSADLRRASNEYAINAAEQQEIRRQSLADLGDTIRQQSNLYAIDAAAQEESQRQIAAAVERSRAAIRRNAALWQYYSDVSRDTVRVVDERTAAWDREAGALDRLRARLDRTSESTRQFSFHWKDLGHNTRQWTLIIAAVLAAMEELSVLGAAAGGGIIALGGAATSGLAGVGGLAAVIVTLNKDLEDLPPSLREVAAEGKAFYQVFGDLRNVIAAGAFSKMEGTFTRLAGSVRSLAPEFYALGESVGTLFDQFERNLRPGTEGLEAIRESLRLAGPNFESLARSAGTFGKGLLQAFNGAQPLVEQLLGYVDRLATQFERFTKSSGFDQWIRNSMTTWSAFGGLLDAVGRTLNNLVTPESVHRTAEFLGDLTDFMPNFERFLAMLGQLNIFGLIAQTLDDLGRGLEPLADGFTDLAMAVSSIASILLTEFGDALNGVSAALAPVVQGLADFLNAMPPEVWETLAKSALLLAGAFVVLKGAKGIAGAAFALADFRTQLQSTITDGGRAGAALGGITRALGLIGVAVGSAMGITALINEIRKLDDVSRNLVASGATIQESFTAISSSGGQLTQNLDDVVGRLGDLGNFFVYTASGFDKIGIEAVNLANTLKALDEPISSLAMTDLTAAQEQFRAYAAQLGATGDEVYTLLEQMPQFKAILEQTATTAGGTATNQRLVALALGETATEAAVAASETAENERVLALLEGRAVTTGDEVDALADKIRGFGSATLDARAADREFQQALADLSAGLAENGATLDITTQAGRDNQAAVDDLAKSILENSAATLEQSDSQEKATATLEAGRQKLIEMLGQFGITGAAAEAYADELGLIPENIETAVGLTGVAAAESTLTNLTRNRTVQISINGPTNTNPFIREGFASGGVLHGPREILAGEAGPEAIVPLNRPLNQVDPSVRWLSAIAQGQRPAMAGGGIVGGGRVVNMEAGAIVVQEADNGDATANGVVRRIFERVSG